MYRLFKTLFYEFKPSISTLEVMVSDIPEVGFIGQLCI